MDTVDELIAALQALPAPQRQLRPCITNGDLPWTQVMSVSVQAAPYGQLVLISRDAVPLPEPVPAA